MPLREESIIRSLLDPKIVLDGITMVDIDTGTEPSTRYAPYFEQKHKQVGSEYPFITINDYNPGVQDIEYVKIDCTGKLPNIIARFTLSQTAVFTKQSMPKDGDILSIFIRARNDAFKPVRNDYLITSVDVGEGSWDGLGSVVTIYGELFIPHLYDQDIHSFKGTSYEAIEDVCRTLNLGFATNETFTQDNQVWICPNDSWLNYIDHIVKHSWKNEKSFFDWYIDIYYHLNFVNVNNQFSEEDNKLDAQILDTITNTDTSLIDGGRVEGGQREIPKCFSNLENLKNTQAFIENFQVINNSSYISREFGYKTFAQFYEQNSEKFWEIYVDPIVTEGASENKTLLRGRPYPKNADGTASERYWETQNRKEWLGIQYSLPEHNSHERYLFSSIWNRRNMEELNKMYISINVTRANFNIYRGERIPVLMMSTMDPFSQFHGRSEGQDEQTGANREPTIDQLYSGYYMIKGMSFEYENTNTNPLENTGTPSAKQRPPGFIEKVYLTRREWPVP